MEHYIDQAVMAMNGAVGITVVISAIVGLALTYAGLRIYWLIVFLVGMIPGGVLAAGVGAAMDWPGIGIAFFTVVCAVISGFISIWLTLFSIFLLGGFVGSLLVLALGVQEPIVIIIGGIICGALFIWLHQVAIIIGTSFSGAGSLTYAAMNAVALMRNGRPASNPGELVDMVANLGRGSMRGGLEQMFRNSLSELLVFLFFFITGLLVQFRFFRSSDKTEKQRPVAAAPAARAPVEVAVAESGAIENAAPLAPPVGWRLALFQDGVHTQTLPLGQGDYLLGAGEEADIRLEDPAVAARHLQIQVCPEGRLSLFNLDQDSGTWKNGTDMITSDTPEDGHWYQIGTAQLVFQQG